MQKNFKTSLLFFLIFFSHKSFSQTIVNGDFEQIDSNLKIKDWKWSNAPGYKFTADPFTHYSGNYSALLVNEANLASETGGAAFIQPFTALKTGIKHLKFSVMVKTQSAAPCGIILNAFCRQYPILSTDMFERGIGGTLDWKRISTEFTLPTYTNGMSFGGMLTGSGKIWFDDFKLEELPIEITPAGPALKKYFTEFIDTLKKNSIRRDSIDFDLLAKDLEIIADGAQTKAEAVKPFQYAFAAMNDNFGAYYDSLAVVKTEELKKEAEKNKKVLKIRFPVGGVWRNEFAIIRISSFGVQDSTQAKAYSDSLKNLIFSLENKKPKGWLIDLRDCSAGDRDALMNGFSPFFYIKDVLTLHYANDSIKTWDYSDTTLRKINKKIPIALLTGPPTRTASESVLIAFKGLDNTRQFGEPTGGASEEAAIFNLSDKAAITFSTGVFSDAKKRKYSGRIKPDQLVEYPKNTQIKIEEDGIVYLATQWISK